MFNFALKSIGPALAAAVAPGLFIFFAAGKITSFWDMIAGGVITILIYLPSAYFIGLKESERALIKRGISLIFG